jgi:hypothetical protein
MNATRYLKMLQDRVWPVISQWENIATLHFKQDGAPPHFANAAIHGCTIISQGDGLADVEFMNGLAAARTWCLVTFDCGGTPRNKFTTRNHETWNNWKKQ